jgi:hypothetical protein
MITTANYIDQIIQKFALLKAALELHGKNGTLNLHKNAELLMMHVLTLSYGYQLKQLGNDPRFPGADIGSEKDGVAVQITSRNDNDKVNDAIEKFLKNGLHKPFPRLIILMMNTRIAKYPLKAFRDPAFTFDPAKDIIDLNDLVQEIKTLMPIQIQMIAGYLETELPAVLGGTSIAEEPGLIDLQADLAKRKLDYFFHTAVNIEFKNGGLSAARLYRLFRDYFNTPRKLFLFHVFEERFRKQASSAKEVVFEIPLYTETAVNYAKHWVMAFTQDRIQIEYAAYYDQPQKNSDLAEELGPMLSVLLASPGLKLPEGASIGLTYQYDTNGRLSFYNQNSPLAADTYMQIFYQDKAAQVTKQFRTVSDDALIELLQEIADHFINEPLLHQHNSPFITINHEGQLQTFNFIRGHIQPSLGEITA